MNIPKVRKPVARSAIPNNLSLIIDSPTNNMTGSHSYLIGDFVEDSSAPGGGGSQSGTTTTRNLWQYRWLFIFSSFR
jgi:hypothetical protein